MAVLRVDHPDILDFIRCKGELNDGNKEIYESFQAKDPTIKEAEAFKRQLLDTQFSNFNISVGITDKFMEAVENKEYYDLINPRNNKVWDTLYAPDVWKTIVEYAHKNGEPGVIFLDEINRKHPIDDEIEGVNVCGEQPLLPYEMCLTGDSNILTDNGVRKLEDIVGEESSYILSTDDKLRKYKDAIYKGEQNVFEIKLENGLTLEATEDHQINVKGKMTELRNIEKGNKIKVFSSSYPLTNYGDYLPKYEMFGWLHGDGWFTKSSVGISFNYPDGDMSAKERLLPEYHKVFGERLPLKNDEISYQEQTETKEVFAKCEQLGFIPSLAIDKELPTTFYDWTIKQQISFIRGLFGADAGINGKSNSQIHFYTSSPKLVKQIQTFLSTIGIHSRKYKKEFKTVKRNPQYTLAITKGSANKFYNLIGLSSQRKMQEFKLSNYKDKEYLEVEEITYIGRKKVYDILEVNKTNEFYANGIAVHNCNLGAVNLANMVEKKGDEYTIDWEKLDKTVRTATRFLDDVITVSEFPISEITEAVEANRKIGIGVMGWAEMLIKLELSYDGDPARELAEYISKIINNTAISESENLAEEKGAFPNFEKSDIETPRRNLVLTTVAPTGSRSIIANTSGGIEPFFSREYFHRDGKGNVKKFSYEFMEEATDDVVVTAQEIEPKDHVLMQAAWQKNIGSSISKTINLPADITIEEVKDMYELAYRTKCKGLTVYRDGSKGQQVLTTKEEGNDSKEVGESIEGKGRGHVKKAVEEATGQRYKLQTGCGTMYFIPVFDDEGNVVETFTESANGGCMAFTRATSRLISLSLRGGIPIDKITDQLLSVGACPSYQYSRGKGEDVSPGASCPGAIALKLKEIKGDIKEVKETKEVEKEPKNIEEVDKCPECGSEKIEHGSGCVTCKVCGWSKCG